jgi:FixJ family two-component response regulator
LVTQDVFNKLEPLMEAMQKVEQDLRDYKWMSRKVEMLPEVEHYRDKTAADDIGASTTNYGVESTLPKPQYTNSDPTYREARKGLRFWERAKRYEKKIRSLENAVRTLDDERERMVAEGLMDGEKIYMLAQALDVSRQTVHDVKKAVIRKLAIELYSDEMSLAD